MSLTAAGSCPAASKGTVYLAQTTSDLRDYADRLRRDFLQHGYTVLPTTPLPDVVDEAEAAIRANLAAARLSVHLIGRNYSLAESLAINGTPSFIIDEALEPGYVTYDVLAGHVSTVRQNGGCRVC